MITTFILKGLANLLTSFKYYYCVAFFMEDSKALFSDSTGTQSPPSRAGIADADMHALYARYCNLKLINAQPFRKVDF